MSWSDWTIDIYFSVAIEAVESLTEVPDRELSSIIRKSIIDCRRKSHLTYSEVMKLAKVKIGSFRALPVSSYAVLIDIDLDLPQESSVRRFKFGSVAIEVTSKLPKYMAGEHFENSWKSPYGIAPKRRFGWMIARCDARTEFEAASLAFEAFSVFTNVSNLVVKPWNILGGEQKPTTLFAQGPYQYIFRGRKLVSDNWFNPNFREEYWKSTKSDGEKFLNNSNSIRSAVSKLSDHPLREVLSSTLAMMGNGMETHKLDERTLHYWTAIERLFSREGEKVPYDKIIKRATFLEKDRAEARMFLSHLASLRNQRVHHGKSSQHHHQVLEYTADLVSRFTFYLIFHGSDFADHAEFLEMAELPADRKALNRRQKAIERRINFIETKSHRNGQK